MIDEIKKEEGKEDDDIIVELPEDLDETETKKESEESTEEDAEVIEEESETEDEAEPEGEETSEEAEAEVKEDTKDNKVFGKRAEKRIKRLVAQKKELEEKLKGYQDEKETWLTERDQLKTRQADSELDAINQYMERLESQEKQALSVLKTAKEASDVDAEIKATDVLASVKAERLVAKQYKARAEKGSLSSNFLSTSSLESGLVPFISPISLGLGKKSTTASKSGCTPLFLKADPVKTGTNSNLRHPFRTHEIKSFSDISFPLR